uniref:NADH-ubiquinone oxidoreductase chain 3 n=1 Tax=Palaemon capensis TaxID=1440474 RepID=A0A385JEM8_9EUCA|nr:NADH dehydrogenase subunit 3 [Palaemon capensis]AXY96096.1 NADH dehydrogenase subunit 3 [Palaemon capensis]
MLILFTSITVTLLLATVIMMLSSILAKKVISDREKSSPFECGFDPKNSARLPFSLRFFLIAIIFLIFDVEITLLLPISTILTMAPTKTLFKMSLFFLTILLLGLYHEWNQGALDWSE